MKKMTFHHVPDLGSRYRLDEEHAKLVTSGVNVIQIAVGDEALKFNPFIAVTIEKIFDQFGDGFGSFKHTHNGVEKIFYYWCEKAKKTIAIGTEKDVIGEMGEEQFKEVCALLNKKV